MVKSFTMSIRSTLKQEGLTKARERWEVLNSTMSGEDWWPPVARAIRKLFDDFVDEQKQAQTKAQNGTSSFTLINTNSLTDLRQLNSSIGHADQIIGVAENGSETIHTKQDKAV